MSAIWNDREFKRLSREAQWTYLMLVTQAEISSAGTLSITAKRWSGYAINADADSLSDDLSELESHRFIVVDWDTEELLVRKFVKWDGGYGNGKRQPAIKSAAESVVSDCIRDVLAVELDILGVPHSLSDRASDRDSDSPSDSHPDAPRVVVTEVSTSRNPQPTTLKPRSIDQKLKQAQAEAFDEFWQIYPKRVAKGAARKAWDKAVKTTPAEAIIKGAQRYASDLSREDRFTAHPATWLNQERWGDEASSDSHAGLRPIWEQ